MMNRKVYLAVLIELWVPVMPAVAQSPQPKEPQPVPKLVSGVVAALGRLEFSIDSRIIPLRKRSGQCVCINASKGVFLTRDVPSGLPRGELTDFAIVIPGTGGKRIKAELIGIDSETGLAFIRAAKVHKFSEVRFARTSNLRLGQRVISVGLLGPRTGNTPYVGVGVVSAVIRLPRQLVFVSGGDLTVSSSPVLTNDGRVIGIVAGQLPMEYRILMSGRWADVRLAGRQTTRFFLPVEEFIGALAEPFGAKPMPWTGVVKFHPVGPEQVGIIKGLGGATAVLVGQVIPDSPASKAGIRQTDAVVAFEGKPLEKMATPALTVAEFTRRLFHRKAGSRVSLTLLRKSKRQTVQMKLAAAPTRPNEAEHCYDKRLGLSARDLVLWDRHVGREKPLLEKGVIVTMIRRDSPSARGRLRPGDIITAVDDRAVPSAAALRGVLEALAKTGGAKPINFIIRRGDKPEALIVTPE